MKPKISTLFIAALLSIITAVGLIAQQQFNLFQINGVTIDTNSGNKSAGTVRMVLATDQPQLTNKLLVTPDSVALPANQSVKLSQDSQANPIITCITYKFDRSTTADVQLVAISGSTTIYVCGYRITGESATTSDVSLEYGTGSSCGTGTTGLTPPFTVGTGSNMAGGIVIQPGIWSGLKTIASQALCAHRSAAQTSEVEVWVAQF